MRKRLRKKKYLNEFSVMGFTVDCHVRPGRSRTQFNQFTDEFIVQAIEVHSLVFGGGGSSERGWRGVVSHDGRYASTTDVDKDVVRLWLEQRSDLESFRFSVFWDLWHGSNPFDTKDVEPESGASSH